MAKKSKPGIILKYPDGQNLFEINAQDDHIAKYQSEFLNIVNKHGHGNDAAIVGMVSQVIKNYRKQSDSPSLDGWKEYDQKLTDIKGIEFGVEKNWAQFQEMKKAIDEQGKLTDEIVKALEASETLTEVEDIYRPYKQKKRTRATIALEKGLKPLAELIMEGSFKGDIQEEASKYIDEEKKVITAEDALNGALDIIAEEIQGGVSNGEALF